MDKNKDIKKIIILGLLISFFLVGSCFYMHFKSSKFPNNPILTLFHTNDIHGVVKGIGGLAQVSKYVKDYRSYKPNNRIIFVNAGDWSRENSYDDYSKGEIFSELINLSGFDYVTVGNHEFNFGYLQFVKNIGQLEIPVLQANMINSNGNSIGQEFDIFETEGLKFGLFSVIAEKKGMFPTNLLSKYRVVNCITKAEEIVGKLKGQDVDFIICISHLGKDIQSTNVIDLANVGGIDLIIDGHSHTQCPEDKNRCSSPNALIARNTARLVNGIGKIDIYYQDGKFELKTERITPYQLNGGKIDLDESYYDPVVINYYRQAVQQQLLPIVKIADVNDPEYRRTLIINTIADGYRYYGESDIAVVNHGVMKNEISGSAISIFDVYKAIADYGRSKVKEVKVVKTNLSGKALKKLFEQSLNAKKSNALQISGAQIIYDSKAKKGKKIKDIYIDGIKVKNKSKYTITFAENLIKIYPILNKKTKTIGVDYQSIIEYFQLIGEIVDDGEMRFVDVAKK